MNLVTSSRRSVLPFVAFEAGGTAAGEPEDASRGLTRMTDSSGRPWAFNPFQNEWQAVHTVRSGDTLWNLSGQYYGTRSLAGVHWIHDVPQNAEIQGPSPDTGLIPGDKILIPRLPQPAAAPSAGPAIPPVGVPPAVVPPSVVPPVAPPANFPITSVPEAPEASPIDEAPDDVHPVLTSTSTPAPITTTGPRKFWTPAKIAIGAGVGLTGLALIIYLATRKPSRRRRAA